jgi:hypothetical protein
LLVELVVVTMSLVVVGQVAIVVQLQVNHLVVAHPLKVNYH